ncbi:hypothetical protein Tco_0410971 [Tanacetum coccineum]
MVRSLMFSFHLRGLEQVNASPLFVLLSLNLTSLVGRPIVRFGLGDIIYIANFVRFERLQKPNTSIPKGTNMETSKTSYVSVLKDGNQSDNSKLALVLDESCIKEHDFDISLIGKSIGDYKLSPMELITLQDLFCSSSPLKIDFCGLGLEYGRYGVSKVFDTAYRGFLGVSTMFDVFQNILFPYSLNTAYCLLLDMAYWILFPLWSLVSAGTETSYLP